LDQLRVGRHSIYDVPPLPDEFYGGGVKIDVTVKGDGDSNVVE
jgi:hypothetical protein